MYTIGCNAVREWDYLSISLDKNLNIDFWADLDSQNMIRQPKLISTVIIRILKVLGPLLLPKKDEKFIHK